MIKYSDVSIGDTLRVVGAGAPGFAKLGEIVEVTATYHNKVDVKNERGEIAFFALTCGAARLEPTQGANHVD